MQFNLGRVLKIMSMQQVILHIAHNFKKVKELRKIRTQTIFVCVRFKITFTKILKRKGVNLRKGESIDKILRK